MDVDPDVLLTVKEYAAVFRLNTSSVYRAIRKGTLPYPVERPTGTDYFLICMPRARYERLRVPQMPTDA